MTPTNPIPAPGSKPTAVKTPRTDAETIHLDEGDSFVESKDLVEADFARQLERELTACQTERAGLVAALKEIEQEAELNEGYAQGELLSGNVVKEAGYRSAAAAYRACASLFHAALSGLPAASNHDEK